MSSFLLRARMAVVLLFACGTVSISHALPPVWSSENSANATDLVTNRVGSNPVYRRSPFNPKQALLIGNIEDDAGSLSGNYQFSIPLVSLSGRGQELSLSLFFNSQTWSDTGNGTLTFNADGDWPSAGWSLGFGKLVVFSQASPNGLLLKDGILFERDKSRLPLQAIRPYSSLSSPQIMQSRADSLIRVQICCSDYPAASATLTDGRGIETTYASFSPITATTVFYPVQMVDSNGNAIEIQYVKRGGVVTPPAIDQIKDTVGRIVKFHYDRADHLVSITGPGLDVGERVYARFTYWPRDIAVNAGNCSPMLAHDDGLFGIIFPDVRHGYWIPMSSGYGINTWWWQTTGVELQDNGLDAEATVSNQGKPTREIFYDYPSNTPNCLTRPPTYTTQTERWLDSVTGEWKSAVTRYGHAETGDDIVTTVVSMPDGPTNRQFVSKKTNTNDGLVEGQIRRVENLDTAGAVMSSTDFEWELSTAPGSHKAPRQRKVTRNIDPLGKRLVTSFAYDPVYWTLQAGTSFYSWGTSQSQGVLELSTSIEYLRDVVYVGNGLLTLPIKRITVSRPNAAYPVRSVVQYEYDKKSVSAVGTLEGHYDEWEPAETEVCTKTEIETDGGGHPHKVCVEWKTVIKDPRPWRGNRTRTVTYADATNNLNPVALNYEYDSTGNVLKSFDDTESGVETTYGLQYGRSLPTQSTAGAMDPASPFRVTTTRDYFAGSGLPKTIRDADGQTTSFEYQTGSGGWMPSAVVSPLGVRTQWVYDDATMSVSSLSTASDGTSASVTTISIDGRGQGRRLSGNAGGPFMVDTEYDAIGRVTRESQPYFNEQPRWTVQGYDALGRVVSVLAPGSSKPTTWQYNGTPAPSVVPPQSALEGETVLVTDPWGHRKWLQTDWAGNLRYVSEPSETVGGVIGNAETNELLTEYQSDAFGRLRKIVYGAQVRSFDYDDLGRLTRQALPERRPTLDATGTFSAGGSQFTDVFQYDGHSNLVTSVDARGVRTRFDRGDPLNRLLGVSYEVPVAHDASSAISAVGPVNYIYQDSGSKSQVRRITSDAGAVDFNYSATGLLLSQTTTFAGQPNKPFKIALTYDAFGRPTSLQYPTRYDNMGAPGISRTLAMTYADDVIRSVSLDGAPLGSFGYRPGGLFQSAVIDVPGGAFTHGFGLDPASGLIASHTAGDNATGSMLYGVMYGYRRQGIADDGLNGRITSVHDLAQPAASQSFFYDPLGRLTAAVRGDLEAWPYDTSSVWQSYGYDMYGNRSRVSAYRLSSYPCGGSRPPCQPIAVALAEYDGISFNRNDSTNHIFGPDFSYDAAGNLTHAVLTQHGAKRTYQISYDAAGRVAEITDDANRSWTYGYGADRQRVYTRYGRLRGDIAFPSYNLTDTYYVWLGSTLLSESSGMAVIGLRQDVPVAWSRDHFYAQTGRVLSESNSGVGLQQHFFVNDHRGTALELRPVAGGAPTVIRRATRPFGTEARGTNDDGADAQRFTTYSRMENGFDDAFSRLYSSELGRFFQTDPLGRKSFQSGNSQSLNAYSYIKNDPINRTDPSGLFEDVAATCRMTSSSQGKCDSDVTEVIAPPQFTDFGPQASDGPAWGLGSSGQNGGFGLNSSTDSGSANVEHDKKFDVPCVPMLAMSGGRGPGADWPGKNTPMDLFKRAFTEKIRQSLQHETTDPAHWRNILTATKTGVRRGWQEAMDLARPTLERGVDLGKRSGKALELFFMGPGSGPTELFFPIFIINPSIYDPNFLDRLNGKPPGLEIASLTPTGVGSCRS